MLYIFFEPKFILCAQQKYFFLVLRPFSSPKDNNIIFFYMNQITKLYEKKVALIFVDFLLKFVIYFHNITSFHELQGVYVQKVVNNYPKTF